MKFDLMFYANYVNILKDYKKLNKSLFNQILDIYQVDKCPDNFEIEIRNGNYFLHNIEKIKQDYINQMPYYLDNSKILYKSSSKVGDKKLDTKTLMFEKDLCKEFWFSSYYGYTKYPFDFIDIELPLQPDKDAIKGNKKPQYGNVDNIGVSINEKKVTIHLIEVKPKPNNETLLRATIEAITYKYIIVANKDTFIKEFIEFMSNYNGKGEQALKIKESILNNEDLVYEIKSLILLPISDYFKGDYDDEIIKYYKDKIDFYFYDYKKEDVVFYLKNERKDSLFKKDSYPNIEKYWR